MEPTIGFTYEHKTNNTLRLLDVFLINNIKLEFKGSHKSTDKNDHIHFYSYHNTKKEK